MAFQPKRTPYGYIATEDFRSIKEITKWVLEKDSEGNVGAVESFIEEAFPDIEPTKYDTSIGGNAVINPYPGGEPDDDIIFPINQIDNRYDKGLGHKYIDVIQNNQKIVWFSFGVPKFNNLKKFYDVLNKDDSSKGNYSKIVLDGNDAELGLFDKLRVTTGKLLDHAVSIPFLPARAASWMFNKMYSNTVGTEISKYYDFQPAMFQYYRLVNSVLSVLAVSMGLWGDKNILEGLGFGDAIDKDNTPEILWNGPSIYPIIDKVRRYNLNENEDNEARDIVGDSSYWKNWINKVFNYTDAFVESAKGADQFIGFRVEKSTDTSETMSNTTGESEIAGILNGVSEKARSATFNLMGGNITGEGVTGMFGAPINAITDTISKMGKYLKDKATINIDAGSTLFTGNGFYDIPEVWKSSSFSKSYSFSIELKSRLSDPVSIYQNIYVPLTCLLSAASPRSIGTNLYTSPFVLQAYVQGMFAIPLGIIDSLSISRGDSDYGWSHDGLPNVVKVNFTIKDLSPVMFLSLYGEENLNIFAHNSSMHEYLATLGGLGLAERRRFSNRWKRRRQTMVAIKRTTKFNPLYWTNAWGNSKYVRFGASLLGANKWPEQKQ